jgi:hypothetical protein
MPSQPVKPLRTPVKLTLPDGTELTSSLDPVTNIHSVDCDICGKVILLGLRGAGNSIYQHRNSEGCISRVFKKEKEAARVRLNVSHLCHD